MKWEKFFSWLYNSWITYIKNILLYSYIILEVGAKRILEIQNTIQGTYSDFLSIMTDLINISNLIVNNNRKRKIKFENIQKFY